MYSTSSYGGAGAGGNSDIHAGYLPYDSFSRQQPICIFFVGSAGGGGDWVGSIDRPHFEVKSNWVFPKGYKLEGQVIVPTSSAVKVQLIVEDNELEETGKDDDTMQFTNKTTKAAVRDHIKQAVDKGLIEKSWLQKFDDGTMTNGDYEGLKLIIAQRSLFSCK